MTIADNAHETAGQHPPVTRPQAPVLMVGRHVTFLDVQPTVAAADDHLSREHSSGALGLDACDYFDGIARPLRPAVRDDGTVVLELAAGPQRPDRLRARINELLSAALEAYDPDSLPADCLVGRYALEPLPDTVSFVHVVDELDRRFNAPVRHVGGRLHNLWHAISG